MLVERVQPMAALESGAKHAKQYESRAHGEGDAPHDQRVAPSWARRDSLFAASRSPPCRWGDGLAQCKKPAGRRDPPRLATRKSLEPRRRCSARPA
jgi:hypothetical protein